MRKASDFIMQGIKKAFRFFGRLSVLSSLSIQHHAPSFLKNVFMHFVCFLIICILLRESNVLNKYAKIFFE
jgi:hypothetical protein